MNELEDLIAYLEERYNRERHRFIPKPKKNTFIAKRASKVKDRPINKRKSRFTRLTNIYKNVDFDYNKNLVLRTKKFKFYD